MVQDIADCVLPVLRKCSNPTMIDATVGVGGHTLFLLKHTDVLSISVVDTDNIMLDIAQQNLASFGNRIQFHHAWFDDFFMCELQSNRRYHVILIDLGVSMYHFRDANRGFSWSDDGVLDMRLNDMLALTAADIVNTYTKDELVRVFYSYGEERQSLKWANRIVEARKHCRIDTPISLLNTLCLGKKPSDNAILARLFQALRIEVNGELDRLQKALPLAWKLLSTGGLLVVISFHSLEDRIVKKFSKHVEGHLKIAENMSIYDDSLSCSGISLTKKPMVPREEEIRENPASKSAKLRIMKKK